VGTPAHYLLDKNYGIGGLHSSGIHIIPIQNYSDAKQMGVPVNLAVEFVPGCSLLARYSAFGLGCVIGGQLYRGRQVGWIEDIRADSE
jgi:hypothetical protein